MVFCWTKSFKDNGARRLSAKGVNRFIGLIFQWSIRKVVDRAGRANPIIIWDLQFLQYRLYQWVGRGNYPVLDPRVDHWGVAVWFFVGQNRLRIAGFGA